MGCSARAPPPSHGHAVRLDALHRNSEIEKRYTRTHTKKIRDIIPTYQEHCNVNSLSLNVDIYFLFLSSDAVFTVHRITVCFLFVFV